MLYVSQIGSESIPQLLERLARRVSFTIMLHKVLAQVEKNNGIPTKSNVTLKVSSDPTRQAFSIRYAPCLMHQEANQMKT